MLHTKSQGHRRRFYKGFYHIWVWQSFWSCDQKMLQRFWLTYHKESSHEIWVQLGKWFVRKLCFNILLGLQYERPWLKGQRHWSKVNLDLFVWFDSLHPINNLSVIKGPVFLGWTSTKLGSMFLLKDTTQWYRWGSNPQPLGLESSTLPLSHCAPWRSTLTFETFL